MTITGYKGIDPEVNRNGLSPGNDPLDKYPTTRTYTLGFNISFLIIKKTIKNMKFIKYIILTVTGLAITVSSCTNLQEEVFSDLTAEQFVPEAKDLPAIMGPAYSTLRTVYFGWTGYFDTMEESSDEVATCSRPRGWYDGGVYERMHKHTWTSLQGHTSSLWDRCYQGITNCNRAIYQVETGIIPLNEDLTNSTLSELKVARAFYLYILCDAFGNIPITTRYDIVEGYLPEQSTRLEVFNFIVSEITESLPYLSEGGKY